METRLWYGLGRLDCSVSEISHELVDRPNSPLFAETVFYHSLRKLGFFSPSGDEFSYFCISASWKTRWQDRTLLGFARRSGWLSECELNL
jgi:hypothetical protein